MNVSHDFTRQRKKGNVYEKRMINNKKNYLFIEMKYNKN
jgi:hypothetical protein